MFLDIACINQTDEQLKFEGLISIGAFLKKLGYCYKKLKSRTLLVLWDPTLVSRRWCIFEMAAFLHSCELDAKKDIVICPVLVGPVFLLGHFGLCVLPLARSLLAVGGTTHRDARPAVFNFVRICSSCLLQQY